MGTALSGRDSVEILRVFGLDPKNIKAVNFRMSVNEIAELTVVYIATKEQINITGLSEVIKRYKLEEIEGES